MDDEIKSALKRAILTSLPIVREQLENHTTPYLVWSKRADGGWDGKFEHRPHLQKVFKAASNELGEASANFAELFLAKYPEYRELVGLAGLEHHRVVSVPRSALGWLWQRHGSFDCDSASVDAIVNEFAEFVEAPTVQLRFQAQLLNYHMDVDSLTLPDGSIIRRLSESEVSVLDGGPLITLGFMRPRLGSPHEFVIEGEVEVVKQVGRSWPSAPSGLEKTRVRLTKAILCLRTFKPRHVGYDYVHFRPVKFCPLAMGSRGCGDLYVPFGDYRMSKEEVEALKHYAATFYEVAEPAMEMACSRLADAATRTRPEDKLVDAVIGLEALLLAGLRKEDRRGELRYRFSLHYSTLFGSAEERYRAFRVARDLYDLRSAIAHGSKMKDRHRVGTDRLKLPEAATRAAEALRSVVHMFLPRANEAPYRQPEFWERAYFGLGQDVRK